jgi:hypothetical protein
MTKLAFILSLTLSTSVLVAACSSSSVNEPGTKPDGEGGAAGAGAAGSGGAAGATQPGGCTQHADCKSFGDCQTLEDLRASECGNDDYTMYVTRCGGTYVEFTGGFPASSWLFDANGQPIGGSYEDEGSCGEWGTTCGPAGPRKPLCADECIPHDSCDEWGANFGCPATLDDVAGYCGLGEIEIQRQPSGCGGTIVDANNGIQHVTWTFDADGKLVAFSSIGDVGDCDYWGTGCDSPPTGTSEPVCGVGGEGGQGGGGGGAGGAARFGGET